MKTAKIKLNSVDDVRDLVEYVTLCDYVVDLSNGSYIINAKSILGLFGFDLNQPIKLIAHSDDCDQLFRNIDRFIVK